MLSYHSIPIIAALAWAPGLNAQPYAIGNSSITFYDALRDRSIPCEVHYPASVDGNDVPVSDGTFRVMVIGHGFVMNVNAYDYLWQHYVPIGYIVALPTTEGGFAPVHGEFGADVAFISQALIDLETDVASPFFGHVLPSAVLMGHSMGGGAALLGAAQNPSIDAVVVLAPAETQPSAVAAASEVQVPTLVFAASEDCVTPVPDHQQPIYDALTVECKALVNITGGGHCYFGDESFTCSFGELTCGPDLTISREEQQDVVTDITDLWLAVHLAGDAGALPVLLDSLVTSTRFVAQHTCLSTAIQAPLVTPGSVSVFTEDGRVVISGMLPGERWRLSDAQGRTLLWISPDGGSAAMNLANLPSGCYQLSLPTDPGRTAVRFALVR